MNRMAQDRLLLGALLRDAVAEGQVGLAYQPQIDAATGVVAGVEALARWTHPALGAIPPGRFIPLAEDFGLIEALGEALPRTKAALSLSRWDAGGLRCAAYRGEHFRHPVPQSRLSRSSSRSALADERADAGPAHGGGDRERDDGRLPHRDRERRAGCGKWA